MLIRIVTNLSFLRFIRVFRILRLVRLDRHMADSASDVSRQIFKVSFSLVSIAFIFAGLFYTCETLMVTPPPPPAAQSAPHTQDRPGMTPLSDVPPAFGSCDPLTLPLALSQVSPSTMQEVWHPPLSRYPLRIDRNKNTSLPEYRLLYHDAFYYTIITMATVGYGDFYPISVPGKFLVSFMIAVTFVIISKQTNKLLLLMSLQSRYARHRYFRTASPHVIVCGNIASNSARDFLQEFFHPDHGQANAKLLILSPHTPDASMEYLLAHSAYEANTMYLEGSAMNENDLIRCEASHCEYVFVLANKFCTDPTAEDAATSLRAISIKKHVAQNAHNRNIPVMLQLIRPENKHNFTSSVYGRKEMSQIICMDEIKLHLLAKSALCPGFSTMVSNLIKSCAEETNEDDPSLWLKEYVGGVGQEIYRTKLSSKFNGMTFGDAAIFIYLNFQSTMFAAEVVDLDEEEHKEKTMGQVAPATMGQVAPAKPLSTMSIKSMLTSTKRKLSIIGSEKESRKVPNKTVLLNPSDYKIGSESETWVFVLADDQEAADKLSDVGEEEINVRVQKAQSPSTFGSQVDASQIGTTCTP